MIGSEKGEKQVEEKILREIFIKLYISLVC